MALTCTTSSVGRNPGSAGAYAFLPTGLEFFEEPFSRATAQYGNVYLLARRSNSSRSCLVRTISYGLLRGKIVPSRHQHNRREGHSCRNYTLLYLCNRVLGNVRLKNESNSARRNFWSGQTQG